MSETEFGFRGFRLVHGESGRLYPHRLHNSQPILFDSYEETGLVAEEMTNYVLELLRVPRRLNFVLVQVFDCRSTGAGNLEFEVDSPNARIDYLVKAGEWDEGPTHASAEAAAVVLNLEPGMYHEIRAVTPTGQLIAMDQVYVPGDAVVMSSLHPRDLHPRELE